MRPKPSLIPRSNLDYNFYDFLYGIKSIFSRKDFDLSRLYKIFGNKSFYFTTSGRSSLYVILKSLNLPIGSKIGVPLYSCPTVFDSITKAGHVPEFIDIDNYTISPKDLELKINNLSAIVAIHTFGFPADMDEIKKVAGDIPVIEDCAHSLLSEYKDEKTGTIGNVSFFSFRLGKYISAGEGGMIILNDPKYKENIEKSVEDLGKYSVADEIKHAFWSYTKSFLYHRPWFGLFALPIGMKIEDKVNLTDKRGFRANRIRNGDFKVFLNKLKFFKGNMEKQRENSKMLIDELKETSLMLPYEKKDIYCNYYKFPILFENKRDRDLAYLRLRNLGIDSSKLFSETPIIAKKKFGYMGDCLKTEEFCKRILIMPNYYILEKKEIIKIGKSVKKILD